MRDVFHARRPDLATVWLGLFAGAAAVAYLLPRSTTLALVVAVVIALVGVVVWNPVVLPVVAMPLLVDADRIGDLSVSDFLLFGSFWVAVLFGRRPFSRTLRNLLWCVAVYQVASLFAVIAHVYPKNTIEWFHAFLITGGALVVGWAIGASGKAGWGLGLFVGMCVLISINAIQGGIVQLSGGVWPLHAVYPSWPFALHKNFAGPTVAVGTLIAFARPAWLGWKARFAVPAFVICLLGVFFIQSRQSLVGLGVSMLVVALRPGRQRPRGAGVLLMLIVPVALYVMSSVNADLTDADGFNSTTERAVGLDIGWQAWHDNPLFGAGLRWFVADRGYPGFQPPNAVVETLSSVGVVGLAGFVVMMIGAVVIAWRLPREFGTLAAALTVQRIVQSQFDQFWVGAHVSIPFVVLGVCVGAAAYAERRRSEEPSLPLSPSVTPAQQGT
ncbi:O-antigen ligase family protein [Xylanimonas protaetiae]|uniref:O-antigen ligase domain-containing protein n=1 Tax=Xylanimonas protaetiae TaxID=2509457 RepID=A0A4P6FEJ5_9MICO|nr:O-antigen ligase family protein [Xylanimonas protaetiae]QAY69028.1 O-antigen ligase domain-containing protein [Xylanimonas protaetiae]